MNAHSESDYQQGHVEDSGSRLTSVARGIEEQLFGKRLLQSTLDLGELADFAIVHPL
jgi:hypothetical protein